MTTSPSSSSSPSRPRSPRPSCAGSTPTSAISPGGAQPSPYRTLVSEFMLQQTVVATVLPYFERFVARFPDFAALAAAREDDVTALWSGLGYYARARNLRRAAIAVVAEHGGVLPGDEETLRALPGVGPYTAAAVAAIAFDRPAFALDGNGIRVLARLYAVREPVNLPATRARLQRLGQQLVPAARAGDFNQAVMELGALVCAPKTPACAACPGASGLRGGGAGAGPGRAAEQAAARGAPADGDRLRSGRAEGAGAAGASTSRASCWPGPGRCRPRRCPKASRRARWRARWRWSAVSSARRRRSFAGGCATSSPTAISPPRSSRCPRGSQTRTATRTRTGRTGKRGSAVGGRGELWRGSASPALRARRCGGGAPAKTGQGPRTDLSVMN